MKITKCILLFFLTIPVLYSLPEKSALYELDYGAKITRNSGVFGSFRLGLPVFMENAFQKVHSISVNQTPSEEIVSRPHTLKYFFFTPAEILNKNKTVEFKITLRLEKKLKKISIENLPWKPYEKSSELYKNYTQGDGFFQTENPYALKIASLVKTLSYPEKVRFIFNHVRKLLRYHAGYRRYRTFSEILSTRAGDCSDYSTFLVTLLRAAGIPARNVTGRILNQTLRGTWHAWVEYYSKGFGWVPCDPANLEITDNKILVGYMPLKYASVHTGVNIPLAKGLKTRSLPVIQTYFYFYEPKLGKPYPRFTFDFIWKLKRLQ